MRIQVESQARRSTEVPNATRTGVHAPWPGSSHTVRTGIALAITVLAMTPAAVHAQEFGAYPAPHEQVATQEIREVVPQPVHAPEMGSAAPEPCFFRSTMYGSGTASCQEGLQYRCTNGAWLALGRACSGEVIGAARSCWLDGGEFATGEFSCRDGMQLRCDDGVWKGSGAPCGPEPAPVEVSSNGESCRYEAITVSTGSTVCQTGTTYLCNDGQWVNMGTMCR